MFIEQTGGRRYLELCQYIVNEVYEGYGYVRKINDKREDCRIRFYKARLKNH